MDLPRDKKRLELINQELRASGIIKLGEIEKIGRIRRRPWIIDKDFLINQYVISGKSIKEISNYTGLWVKPIQENIEKLGIRRSHSETLKKYYRDHPQKLKELRERQARLSGEKCHFWKGGKPSKGFDGYVKIYMPEYPKASQNRVLEHLVVWEKTHNQSLPEGYNIHHINGVRDDNRPNNLMALPRKKHTSFLLQYEMQKKIRELEAEIMTLNKRLSSPL